MGPQVLDPAVGRPRRRGLLFVLALLLLLLLLGRSLASYIIEYQWWNEIGQLQTFYSQMLYGLLPPVVAALLFFAVLWVAHARGLKAAGTGLSAHPNYSLLSTLALLALASLLALITVDSDTIVRFAGGQGIDVTNTYRDPAFGRSLAFYFFDLPFYTQLLRLVLVLAAATALVYFLVSRFWSLRSQFGQRNVEINLSDLRVSALSASTLVRTMSALFLLALAATYYLDRYRMVLTQHA